MNINDLKQSLQEAQEYRKGARKGFRVTHLDIPDVDVKSVRKKLKMTQAEFANAFALSLHTLRKWEQKERAPEGPARTLLHIINKEPQAVLRAIQL